MKKRKGTLNDFCKLLVNQKIVSEPIIETFRTKILNTPNTKADQLKRCFDQDKNNRIMSFYNVLADGGNRFTGLSIKFIFKMTFFFYIVNILYCHITFYFNRWIAIRPVITFIQYSCIWTYKD